MLVTNESGEPATSMPIPVLLNAVMFRIERACYDSLLAVLLRMSGGVVVIGLCTDLVSTSTHEQHRHALDALYQC
jgi:hypothetical protein